MDRKLVLTRFTGEGTEYIDVNELAKLKGLQFVQLNARSIFHKFAGFKHDFVKDCIGVIGITERWLKESMPDSQVSLNNYRLDRNDRKTGRGGGTCLFI